VLEGTLKDITKSCGRSNGRENTGNREIRGVTTQEGRNLVSLGSTEVAGELL